jgi:AbrB family looped-hinge helix DNA binding protein
MRGRKMSTVTKKGQVTIPKPVRDQLHIKEGDSLHFEVKDDVLILKRKERKSLLSLGGIAKGRRVGTGEEREYTKRAVARKRAKEGI